VGADPYQIVVQRGCWDDAGAAADYTLRVDSAAYECPSMTCPEPEYATLTGDDIVAATITEYSVTQGWRIEGDLIWE
jgi:hypothetical protein